MKREGSRTGFSTERDLSQPRPTPDDLESLILSLCVFLILLVFIIFQVRLEMENLRTGQSWLDFVVVKGVNKTQTSSTLLNSLSLPDSLDWTGPETRSV